MHISKDSGEEFITQKYHDYKKNISSGNSAISLELGLYLFEMTKSLNPKLILDLGSGFSSFVFRYVCKQNAGVMSCWSVDDSREWLDQTRKYLTNNSLDVHYIFEWRDFLNEKHPFFDLIFVDIRPISRRVESLDFLLEILSPKGKMVFDDFHKPHLSKPLLDYVSQRKLKLTSIKSSTLDSLGRYSVIIEK